MDCAAGPAQALEGDQRGVPSFGCAAHTRRPRPGRQRCRNTDPPPGRSLPPEPTRSPQAAQSDGTISGTVRDGKFRFDFHQDTPRQDWAEALFYQCIDRIASPAEKRFFIQRCDRIAQKEAPRISDPGGRNCLNAILLCGLRRFLFGSRFACGFRLGRGRRRGGVLLSLRRRHHTRQV